LNKEDPKDLVIIFLEQLDLEPRMQSNFDYQYKILSHSGAPEK
jgi:hypothetical protein